MLVSSADASTESLCSATEPYNALGLDLDWGMTKASVATKSHKELMKGAILESIMVAKKRVYSFFVSRMEYIDSTLSNCQESFLSLLKVIFTHQSKSEIERVDAGEQRRWLQNSFFEFFWWIHRGIECVVA